MDHNEDVDIYGFTIPVNDGRSIWIGIHKVLFEKDKIKGALDILKSVTPEDFEHCEKKRQQEEYENYDITILEFIFLRMVETFINFDVTIDLERFKMETCLSGDNKLFMSASGVPMDKLSI